MKSICGLDCCEQCSRLEVCGGCRKTDGHPFGRNCMAAECIKHGGEAEFQCVKKELISEFNALGFRTSICSMASLSIWNILSPTDSG